jgi:hypothetical protein
MTTLPERLRRGLVMHSPSLSREGVQSSVDRDNRTRGTVGQGRQRANEPEGGFVANAG